jgi:hypothetical protein
MRWSSISRIRNPFFNAMIVKKGASPFGSIGTMEKAMDVPAGLPTQTIDADLYAIPAMNQREHYRGDQSAVRWVSGHNNHRGTKAAAIWFRMIQKRVWRSNLNVRHVQPNQQIIEKNIEPSSSKTSLSLALVSNAPPLRLLCNNSLT